MKFEKTPGVVAFNLELKKKQVVLARNLGLKKEPAVAVRNLKAHSTKHEPSQVKAAGG